MSLFINGHWISAEGAPFTSENPGTAEVLWQGASASKTQIDTAIHAARETAQDWAFSEYKHRESIVLRFAELLGENVEQIAEAIGRETGKPLWEARTEAAAMKGKIAISIKGISGTYWDY